jgi:solute carrier family 12 sodium/potassium/chloride transporter 2
MSLPYHPRLWKPSIVIPVEKPEDFRRISRLLQSIIFPSGRIYYMSVYQDGTIDEIYQKEIDDELIPLKEKRIFAQKVLIKFTDFNQVLIPALECLSSTFLSPNAVLFTISDDLDKRLRFKNLYEELKPIKMNVMCLWLHPKYNIGPEQKINIWLRDKSPNNDLIVLCALQIAKNVGAEIKLCRVVYNDEQKNKEEKQLKRFIEDARLPLNTKINLLMGEFKEIFKNEIADLSILGMPSQYEEMLEVVETAPGSLLFIATGGMENDLS